MNAPLLAGDTLEPLADFARLYRSTLGLVRAVLARLGVSPAAVDDATQDVYVVLYRHRARFEQGRAVEPWLVGIARRVAFRYRRSHARKQRAHEALAWVSADAVAESTAARIEARQFLERFIAELTPERRHVFVLGELYGMTGPEIARRLDIPVDTAYTRLRATRLQLERALVAATADEPAPTREVAHHGWLVLLPRLVDSPAAAAAGGGWLTAALSKLQSSLGVVVLAGVASVAAIVATRPPSGLDASAAGSRGAVASSSSAPASIASADPAPSSTPAPIASPAAAVASTSSTPASRVTLPPPPPDSRLLAMLGRAGSPAASASAQPAAAQEAGADPLGAGQMAAAVEALSAGQPAAALALVDQHARDFPDSALAETRTITRVRALCLLGRAREARGEAAALRSRAPAVARDAFVGTCAELP